MRDGGRMAETGDEAGEWKLAQFLRSILPLRVSGPAGGGAQPSWRRAGDENRTHVSSLGSSCSTIELHPRSFRMMDGSPALSIRLSSGRELWLDRYTQIVPAVSRQQIADLPQIQAGHRRCLKEICRPP